MPAEPRTLEALRSALDELQRKPLVVPRTPRAERLLEAHARSVGATRDSIAQLLAELARLEPPAR